MTGNQLSRLASLCVSISLSGILLAAVPEPEVNSATHLEQPVPLPAMRQTSANYQACVNKIMSSLDSAAIKRELIASKCKAFRDQLIATFPEPIQSLVAINTDRRLESILNALEQVESLIDESTADIYGISVQLQLLPVAVPDKLLTPYQ